MTEQSNRPQNPPAKNKNPEVYTISQDKDGSFHFSRRNFLYFSAGIGGALLVRGVCPRFGTKPIPRKPAQGQMMPLSQVYIHDAPSIASNIADTLQPNDFVRLINDHPDLDWVEVATQSTQHGWVKRSSVDFSRAVKSSSSNFRLSDSPTPTPTQTQPLRNLSVQLHGGDSNPKNISSAGRAQACGEIIQNGDFEAGSSSWVEVSTGSIIRNDWPTPYQGSWVAWLGGLNAQEKLTQLLHLPVDVQDAQIFGFYLKVTTDETGTQVYDKLLLRFLNASGNPISSDINIANNTTPMNWTYIFINLNGMTQFADQDIQIQFECVTDSSNNTSFVLDSVSLNLICGPTPTPTPVFYVYLPVIVSAPPPTATNSPTSTPIPSSTPCPSDCSYDCPSDCSSDCTYDSCTSDCTFDCIYDCTFDCIYDCGFN